MTNEELVEIGKRLTMPPLTEFQKWKMTNLCKWYGGQILNIDEYKGPKDPEPQYPRITDHASNI